MPHTLLLAQGQEAAVGADSHSSGARRVIKGRPAAAAPLVVSGVAARGARRTGATKMRREVYFLKLPASPSESAMVENGERYKFWAHHC